MKEIIILTINVLLPDISKDNHNKWINKSLFVLFQHTISNQNSTKREECIHNYVPMVQEPFCGWNSSIFLKQISKLKTVEELEEHKS